MNQSGRRLIFLTGAPLSSSLQWNDEVLTAPMQECFLEGLKIEKLKASLLVQNEPVWRSLSLEQEYLHPGFTQMIGMNDLRAENAPATFLDTSHFSLNSGVLDRDPNHSSIPCKSTDDDLLTQYYEHSFAVHQEIPDSRITEFDSLDETSFVSAFDDTSTSFETSASDSVRKDVTSKRLASSLLSDLKCIPYAQHLRSIAPQTVTANLVVGIISISQPRQIRTRRGRRTVELVEMLVGDDTKAGFGINLWLPDSEPSKEGESRVNDLRSVVARLRPRDIILARNIALDSFQGRVYGQSLRKNMTTLDLLYRNTVDSTDQAGAYTARDLKEGNTTISQLAKVRKVRQWVMEFVGAGTSPSGSRPAGGHDGGGGGHQLEALPQDTQ